MGLDEDAVDLFEIDGSGLVADGFDQGTQTEIAGSAQESFAGADDQGQGFLGEGVVAQAGTVELGKDELFHHFGTQTREHDRVRDAGADLFVDGQRQGLQERRLADEDQVVRVREVFAKQTQFAQAFGRHEVGVVDDGDEHFAGAMDFEGFLDQEAFAMVVPAFELDLKGLAKDAQGVVVGVEGAIDDGCDDVFGVVGQERLFEHAFAGAGFAEHQAEAALLGVDFEDIEDFLLMGEQVNGFGVEGIALNAEVGADHRSTCQG